MQIGRRSVEPGAKPLIVPEIGINHDGDIKKCVDMIDSIHAAGAECVKMQLHIPADEMVPNNVCPPNAGGKTIWEVIEKTALTVDETYAAKNYAEAMGLIWFCTPFGRQAADELNQMGVEVFKIGSGECNNYPLIRHIAGFGKPVILSTGMNTMRSIRTATDILKKTQIDYAVLHCTSMYPAPPSCVHLCVMQDLKMEYKIVGYSDHSVGLYAAFAAIAMGALIIEKHFCDEEFLGPDTPCSMDEEDLSKLVVGALRIDCIKYGIKDIQPGEREIAKFAYASVVSTHPIAEGEPLTRKNTWVKRPSGGIPAARYEGVLRRRTVQAIPANCTIQENWLEKPY